MFGWLHSLFASDLAPGEKASFFWWYPPGTDTKTKLFLWKLDAAVITYGCLAYWVKYLDQSNLTNAYVSGLKEDLNVQSNEYTWYITYFTIGTSLSQIPSNYLITLIPPRWLLPGAEFLWGILTLALYKVTNSQQIYALRFCIGFLEGSTFVGMIYIFGSWYSRKELGKRLAIFACCAYLGSMFSGYLQSAVHAGLDGRNGLAGWRWVFIIDALITFVCAGFGFVFFPGTPSRPTAWYLTEEEKVFAVERLLAEGKGDEFSAGGWSVFKRLANWKTLLFVCAWIGWSNTLGKYIGTVFSLWLKSDPQRWSLYQINNIPTASGGLNIFAMLLTGWLVDMTGRRFAIIITCLSLQIMGTVFVLSTITQDAGPLGLKFVGLLLGALDGPTSPLIMGYVSILLAGDEQKRSLTIACMNAFGSAVSTIVNTYGYDTNKAPRFPRGISLSLAFVVFEVFCVFAVRHLQLRQQTTRLADEQADKVESGSSDVVDAEEEKKAYALGAPEVVPVATR
ncbi:hypothetical protein JCM10449v2_007183 [Rhodotorula kratochvilovae]